MTATHLRAFVVILGTLVACSLGPGARASMITIDFDATPTGINVEAPLLFNQTANLTDTYAPWGVTFGADSGPLDGGSILHQDARFGVGAISGTNFLAFNKSSTNSLGGRPIGPEVVTFDVPVTMVSIFAASGWTTGAFSLAAYRDGVMVAMDEQACDRGSYVELDVQDAIGFDRVMLSETSGAMAWVFDDLSFGQPQIATSSAAAVPAPASALLAAPVLLGLLAGVRRRRRR